MIGQPRFTCEVVTSTNDLAKTSVAEGCLEGSTFTAKHQTAGRGRRGTSWNARVGESVLMTVVVYPDSGLDLAWRLGWIACVAIIETLTDFGISSACKWPNDVLIDGCKVAGILIETVPMASGKFAAIIGIGVNVLQESFADDNDYRIEPTSMAMNLLGGCPNVDDVVDRLCQALDSYYRANGSTWPLVVDRYSSALITGMDQTGTEVAIGSVVSGTLVGIRASDGSAELRLSDGTYKFVLPELGNSQTR